MNNTDTELENLQLEIREVTSLPAGKRRYPKGLIPRVLRWFEAAEGSKGQRARLLGLSWTTLARWRQEQAEGAQRRPGRLRRIAIAVSPTRPAKAPSTGFVLELPGGTVVRGLSLTELAQLLKTEVV